MNERHVRVLHMVAESYIETAHPVPSQHIAKRLDVSSATVRNDFGSLEDDGLRGAGPGRMGGYLA